MGPCAFLVAYFLTVRNAMFVKVGAGFTFSNSRLSADVNVKKDKVEG